MDAIELKWDDIAEDGVTLGEAARESRGHLDQLSYFFKDETPEGEDEDHGVRNYDSFYDAVIESNLWFRDSIHSRFKEHFLKTLASIERETAKHGKRCVDRIQYCQRNLVHVVRIVDSSSLDDCLSQAIVTTHEMLRMMLSIIMEKSSWKDEVESWDEIPFAIQRTLRAWEIPPYRFFQNPRFCEHLVEEEFRMRNIVFDWSQNVFFDSRLLEMHRARGKKAGRSVREIAQTLPWDDDDMATQPSEIPSDISDSEESAESEVDDSICSDVTSEFDLRMAEGAEVTMIRNESALLQLPNRRIIHPFVLSLAIYQMSLGIAEYMHRLGDGSGTSSGITEDYARMACPNVVYMQIRECLRTGHLDSLGGGKTRIPELLLEYIYLMGQVLVSGDHRRVSLPTNYAKKRLCPKYKKKFCGNILTLERERMVCEKFYSLLHEVFSQAHLLLEQEQTNAGSSQDRQLSLGRITSVLDFPQSMDWDASQCMDPFWLEYHRSKLEEANPYLLIRIENTHMMQVQDTLLRYRNKQLVSDYTGVSPSLDGTDAVWCVMSKRDFDFLAWNVIPYLMEDLTRKQIQTKLRYSGFVENKKRRTIHDILHENVMSKDDIQRVCGRPIHQTNESGETIYKESKEEYWYRQLERKRRLAKFMYEDSVSRMKRMKYYSENPPKSEEERKERMEKLCTEISNDHVNSVSATRMIAHLYDLEALKIADPRMKEQALRDNPYKVRPFHVHNTALTCNMDALSLLDHTRSQLLDGHLNPNPDHYAQAMRWEGLTRVFLGAKSFQPWHMLFSMKRIVRLFSKTKQHQSSFLSHSPRLLYGRYRVEDLTSSGAAREKKRPAVTQDLPEDTADEEEEEDHVTRRLRHLIPQHFLANNIYSQRRRCHTILPDPRIPLELRILHQMHSLLPKILANVYPDESAAEEQIWCDLVNPYTKLDTLSVQDVYVSSNLYDMEKPLSESVRAARKIELHEDSKPYINGFGGPEITANIYTAVASFFHLFSARHMIHQSALFRLVEWMEDHPAVHRKILRDPQLTLGWMLMLKMSQAYFVKESGPDLDQIFCRDESIPIPNSPFVAYTGYLVKDYYLEREVTKNHCEQPQALLNLVRKINRGGKLVSHDDTVVQLTEDMRLLEMPPVFHIYHLLALPEMESSVARYTFLNIRCKYFRAKNVMYFPGPSPTEKQALDYYKMQIKIRRELSSSPPKEKEKFHPLEFLVGSMEFLSHFPFEYTTQELILGDHPIYRGNLGFENHVMYRNPMNYLKFERGYLTPTQSFFPLYAETRVMPPNLHPALQQAQQHIRERDGSRRRKLALKVFNHAEEEETSLSQREFDHLCKKVNGTNGLKGYFYFAYASNKLPRPFCGMDRDMFSMCLLYPCDQIQYSPL